MLECYAHNFRNMGQEDSWNLLTGQPVGINESKVILSQKVKFKVLVEHIQ